MVDVVPKYARKAAVGVIGPDETLKAGLQGIVGGSLSSSPLGAFIQMIRRMNGSIQTRFILVTDRKVYVAGIRGLGLKVNEHIGEWPIGDVAVERLSGAFIRVGDERISHALGPAARKRADAVVAAAAGTTAVG